jgi:hypothetical protein
MITAMLHITLKPQLVATPINIYERMPVMKSMIINNTRKARMIHALPSKQCFFQATPLSVFSIGILDMISCFLPYEWRVLTTRMLVLLHYWQ